MYLAAYQPDIPQNTGALIRLAASLNVQLHLIEPFGFLWDDRKIRTAAMDYIDHVRLTRHASWGHFIEWVGEKRIILLSTKAALPYTDFTYKNDDVLLLGRESAGVPDDVHNAATARVLIPMNPHTRSLNIVIAGAMVLGEALRQTTDFPQT
ncbi:MAG: tRNA (cytidine(34)-2'-O)-methyltransferase [Pseudobdellovibrionaceae bacterium]